VLFTGPLLAKSMSEEDDAEQTLKIGALSAAAVGMVMACSVFIYYKYYHKTGYVENSSEEVQGNTIGAVLGPHSKGPNWVDVSSYNGVDEPDLVQVPKPPPTEGTTRPKSGMSLPALPSNLPTLPNLAASMFNKANRTNEFYDHSEEALDEEDDYEESSPSRTNPVANHDLILPTDMRTSVEDFRVALEHFYSKWSRSMTPDEIAMAVEAYGKDGESRAELDFQLQTQFGQGLDDYYIAMESGSDPVPPPAEAEIVIIESPTDEEDEDELSDIEKLRIALEDNQSEGAFDVLVENGVLSVQELLDIESDSLSYLVPEEELRLKIAALIEKLKTESQH